MRIAALILMILIGLLTYDIFQGKNGIAQYQKVSQELAEAQKISEHLARRNNAVRDEINDLEQGDLSIEEMARSELGLIKKDETFYRIINPEQNEGAGE